MLNVVHELIIKNSNDYLENIVIPDLIALNPRLKKEILQSYNELKPKLSEQFLNNHIDTRVIINDNILKEPKNSLLCKIVNSLRKK